MSNMKKIMLAVLSFVGLLQASDDRALKAIKAYYKNGECAIVPSTKPYGAYLVTGIRNGCKVVLTSYFDADGKEVLF